MKSNTKKLKKNQKTEGPVPLPGPCKHIWQARPMPEYVVCVKCGKYFSHEDL
jgi:hypothetical protein